MPPEIVCFSGNPALDRRLRVSSLRVGEVNRAWSVESLPGGKAAHVAMASTALGLSSLWVGVLGGAIGQECAAALRALGISLAVIPTASSTRINLELIGDSGDVTEVLEPGIPATPDEQAGILKYISKALATEWKGALLAISGSLPSGMRPDFYASIIKSALASGSKTFLDTSGDWLLQALGAQPDFVKISGAEAEVLLPPAKDRRNWAIAAARELIRRGARSAAVTLGEEGLVWLESSKGPAWSARPPKLKCASTVGCGDTTLAGFAHAALKESPGEQAVRFAAACGAANCLAELTGRISMQQVQSLMSGIKTERLT